MGEGRRIEPPPLGLYKEGEPSFFKHPNIPFFLLLLPGSGLPLFGVCTRIGVLHHKAGCRSAGVGIRSRLSSAARLVRGPGGTSIVPYVYNLFEALNLWCYFVAGGFRESSSPVVVFYTTGRS